jgi:hypothetical protein
MTPIGVLVALRAKQVPFDFFAALSRKKQVPHRVFDSVRNDITMRQTSAPRIVASLPREGRHPATVVCTSKA